MKTTLFLIACLFSFSAFSQDGKATTVKKTFSRTTTITQNINASPEKVWQYLTDATQFAKWNSTVVSLHGAIVKGGKLRLVSTLDTSRTFKLKVKEMKTNERLVWGDAMGERVYTLTKTASGTTLTMTEKIGGLMFPMFANKIPSFDASFEQFVKDLKNVAEKKHDSHEGHNH